MNVTTTPADSPTNRPDDLPSAPRAAERDRQLRGLDQLRSLAAALADAADWFESSLNKGPKPYNLIVVRSTGLPECFEFKDVEQLVKAVSHWRDVQLADPDDQIYVFMFRGDRLLLQKGPCWALVNGNEVLPLGVTDDEEFVDESGALF